MRHAAIERLISHPPCPHKNNLLQLDIISVLYLQIWPGLFERSITYIFNYEGLLFTLDSL